MTNLLSLLDGEYTLNLRYKPRHGMYRVTLKSQKGNIASRVFSASEADQADYDVLLLEVEKCVSELKHLERKNK